MAHLASTLSAISAFCHQPTKNPCRYYLKY